jgi:hypothetical protein
MVSVEDIQGVQKNLMFWLRRWYRCPLAYVIEHIGDIPTHQQAQILKAFEHHNFVAVKSGHGIGKSKLTGWLVNWWLDTRGKRAPITGAGGDQLSDIIWPEVVMTNDKKWEWISKQYEKTTEELRQKKARELAKAVLRTARADNDDALQGFHDCMFFIDEASGVRDGIFEVASGAMGDPGAYGFMDGNPTRLSGYMYNVFHKKTRWYTLSFSSEDSLADKEYSYNYVDALGNIREIKTRGRQTQKWIEDMRTDYGINSNAYRVRVLGEFANIGRDQVVEERYMSGVFSHGINVLGKERIKRQYKRRMGIDPAWTGDDDTGVVIREGDEILHAESWHGFDIVESFNRARMLYNEWDCDVVHIDTVGVGAGLFDMFRHTMHNGKMGYPAIRVHCSESAPVDDDGNCAKLRDWLWWKCRKFFRTRGVKFAGRPDDLAWKTLKDEILSPTYKIQNGQIKIEGKDEMKKRGLRSPNLADALNLTFMGDNELFKVKYSNSGSNGRFGGRDAWREKWKKERDRSWKVC